MTPLDTIDRDECAEGEQRATVLTAKLIGPDGRPIIVSGKVLQASLHNPWVGIDIGRWTDEHVGHRVTQKRGGSVMMEYAYVPPSVLLQLGIDADDPHAQIVISLIAENRRNLLPPDAPLNQKVLCVPGGFAKLQGVESPADAASREFKQETGSSPVDKVQMNAVPQVPNRLFDRLDIGYGNSLFVADPSIPFSELRQATADGLAYVPSDVPLWISERTRGLKGEQVYYVFPKDVLTVSPDLLAAGTALGAVHHAWKRTRLEMRSVLQP